MELWGCPMGSKRSPWSKSDQKGVQKQHSEKGSKKVTKTMFSDVLNVAKNWIHPSTLNLTLQDHQARGLAGRPQPNTVCFRPVNKKRQMFFFDVQRCPPHTRRHAEVKQRHVLDDAKKNMACAEVSLCWPGTMFVFGTFGTCGTFGTFGTCLGPDCSERLECQC